MAKSALSPLINRSPAAPFSSTALKAGISLATTAVPAESASVNMIPKDSLPVLGAA